jgi:hypothetical protein
MGTQKGCTGNNSNGPREVIPVALGENATIPARIATIPTNLASYEEQKENAASSTERELTPRYPTEETPDG